MFSLKLNLQRATSTTVFAISLVAMACTAQAEGLLKYATGTDAQTLDPHFVTDIPTARIVSQIHETLIGRTKDGNTVGLLAESWDVSDDGLTWTFKLRENVKFHDGQPFNAEAVKFSFERVSNPQNAAPRATIAGAFKSVDVIDDYTVAITTESAFAPLLSQLSAYPLSIVSPAAGGALNAEYSRAPAGTGPFQLGKWQVGEKIDLVRNDEYWNGPAKIEKVEIKVIPEDGTRLLSLLSGEADIVANVSPVMLSRLSNSPDIEVINETGIRTIYTAFNMNMSPFDDIRVRKAFAHAVDTKALLDGVMNGVGSAGGSLESPALPGAPVIPPYEYNPELARELLKEAGYPDGLKVDFYVPTGRYVNDRQLGEAIQAQLAEVGIDAALHSPEWGAYISLLDAGDKVPMFLLGKGSPTGDIDYTLHTNVIYGASSNQSNYRNDDVETLIAKQRVTVDTNEREKLFEDILNRVYDDVPWIVLFYENQVFAQRNTVSGFEVLPNELVEFKNTTTK